VEVVVLELVMMQVVVKMLLMQGMV